MQNRSKAKLSALRKKEELAFYSMISPWIIGFVCLTLGPLLISFVTSFSTWDGITAPKFNGLSNYITMFTADEQFVQSSLLTAKYVLLAVPTSLIFALLLAALLCRSVKSSGFFQALYYFPSIVSGAAIYLVWTYMYDPVTGIVNYFLSLLGITGPPWLASPDWALPAIIIMNLFFCGSQMLIFVAGIKQIPSDYYEAAMIDGANSIVCFFKITLPLLAPFIVFNLIMGIISSIQVFAQAFIMTAGGPAKSTYFFVYYLYETAFKFNDFGYASAMTWVMFLVIFVLSLGILKGSAGGGEKGN